ncbi:glycosyl hydrolase [Virgisporangium aliadipatigenens]|uniref:Glycosyl hydrolase n=1 Tax=Virgisporangium aliadipatigenens TaxID=741659 RepID=A0A8J3YF84_9ACTN|nr:glycosyl hydrolase [Virgisporangium aliadipatigenens]
MIILALIAAGLNAPFAFAAADGPDLASGRATAASSTVSGFPAANITDGNQASYWESAGGAALPQWAQVDLGQPRAVAELVLRLPSGWAARTQTIAVQGGTDGSTFATVRAAAGYTFDPSAQNTVRVTFPSAQLRYLRLVVSANTGWPAAQLSTVEAYGPSGGSPNLAAGKTFTASSANGSLGAGNAGDGNRATYWESANSAFPQWIQVDLGATVAVDRLVLRLPLTDWGARTQTLTVRGSNDGSAFHDIVASAGYVFAPSTDNTVTVTFGATSVRYVRLHVTGNTGWPAAQLAEFEVYGPSTGDTQAPSAPGALAFSQPSSTQIRLTWNAATDNVGVTGYDVYANGALRTTVAGTVLTYTDEQPASATVTYTVRARDAAGNVSPDSNSVTRTGAGGDTQPPTAPTNLAYTQPSGTQIRLTWNAGTDNVGVTAYDVYANGALRFSVAGAVLTYTDEQPASATVTYTVRARDAAGNASPDSNAVTRTGTGTGANLAVGKPISASSTVHTYVATNANDNDPATYWESAGGAYPASLTVKLGANASITGINLRLNPDPAWGRRVQRIEILGRAQDATGLTTLRAAADYTFDPASGNVVRIALTATAADVELRLTANSGAPGGQLAEFEVIGTPAPNPDLTVTGLSWNPADPVESDAVTVAATVRNAGTAPAAATTLKVTPEGTGTVPALAAGASATVNVPIGTRAAGSYTVTAQVDPDNTVIEQSDTNNTYTAPNPLVVRPVSSSDLVAASVAWTPAAPAPGATLTFAVALRNDGTLASAAGAHGITLTVLDGNGTVVRTLTGVHSGTIAAGATTAPVSLGTWTSAAGRFTVRVVIADDANEVPVKRANNTSERPLFVGRGANLPFDTYEAEDGVLGGGAAAIGPNRTVGDPAGEASGRRAVTLANAGASVEWTTRAQANTLVVRFTMPDAAGGGGLTSTLNLYVDGVFHKAIDLTSKYAWLYGAESGPGNSPGAGAPRHIYDEANVVLDRTVNAGSRIKLQKDPANGLTYTVDFVSLEQATALANPDPARYAVPTGFGQQDVQAAIDRARQDANLVGVYLPAGTYPAQQKYQVYGKALRIVGAGPWFTRITAPPGQQNTDIGFEVGSGANGATFAHLAVFGNFVERSDSSGKVFNVANASGMTFQDIWVEHQVVFFWGANTDNMTIRDNRIRDTFADAINMTNGSTGNLVANNESRSSGDDSFALFNAQDGGGGDNRGNVFENLTSILTWRAAGLAVYGGFDNVFRNLYIADTLVYSGITISSLNFGYPFNGFGASPPTRVENATILRAGGHFWGDQVFPAIWCFSASKEFQGIRVSDVDIVDPTYVGVMFQTKYSSPGSPEFAVTDTILTNVSISGARRSGDRYDAKSGIGIWANELPEPDQGPAVGQATFRNVRYSNNAENVRNTTTTFRLVFE